MLESQQAFHLSSNKSCSLIHRIREKNLGDRSRRIETFSLAQLVPGWRESSLRKGRGGVIRDVRNGGGCGFADTVSEIPRAIEDKGRVYRWVGNLYKYRDRIAHNLTSRNVRYRSIFSPSFFLSAAHKPVKTDSSLRTGSSSAAILSYYIPSNPVQAPASQLSSSNR